MKILEKNRNLTKNSLIVSLVVFLLLSNVGCKSHDKIPMKETKVSSVTEVGYSFPIDNILLVIGEDPTADIMALDNEKSTFKAPSCAMQGEDEIYTYSSFVLTVNESNGIKRLISIRLTDDAVETFEGAYIGMTKEEIIKIYGEGLSNENSLTYQRGNTELNVIFEDGIVVSIEYRLIEEE